MLVSQALYQVSHLHKTLQGSLSYFKFCAFAFKDIIHWEGEKSQARTCLLFRLKNCVKHLVLLMDHLTHTLTTSEILSFKNSHMQLGSCSANL